MIKNYGRIEMNQTDFLFIVITQVVQQDLVQRLMIKVQNKCKQVVNTALCKLRDMGTNVLTHTHIFPLWYGK